MRANVRDEEGEHCDPDPCHRTRVSGGDIAVEVEDEADEESGHHPPVGCPDSDWAEVLFGVVERVEDDGVGDAPRRCCPELLEEEKTEDEGRVPSRGNAVKGEGKGGCDSDGEDAQDAGWRGVLVCQRSGQHGGNECGDSG